MLAFLLALQISLVFASPISGDILPESENPESVCVLKHYANYDDVFNSTFDFSENQCTAVLISESKVITAGHCIQSSGVDIIRCMLSKSDDAMVFESAVVWEGVQQDPPAELPFDYFKSYKHKAAQYKKLSNTNSNPWDFAIGTLNKPMPLIKPAEVVLDPKAINSLLESECRFSGTANGGLTRTVNAPKARMLVGVPVESVFDLENTGLHTSPILDPNEPSMAPIEIWFGSKPIHEFKKIEMTTDNASFNYVEHGDSGGGLFCRKSQQEHWKLIGVLVAGMIPGENLSIAIPFSNPLIKELLK